VDRISCSGVWPTPGSGRGSRETMRLRVECPEPRRMRRKVTCRRGCWLRRRLVARRIARTRIRGQVRETASIAQIRDAYRHRSRIGDVRPRKASSSRQSPDRPGELIAGRAAVIWCRGRWRDSLRSVHSGLTRHLIRGWHCSSIVAWHCLQEVPRVGCDDRGVLAAQPKTTGIPCD
jgi:hypothetical protein